MARSIVWILVWCLTLPSLAVASDYKIRTGDVLRVEVVEDRELNRKVLVLPDGSISFPMAGNVRARGRSVGQIQSDLKAGLASSFATGPSVFVSVERIAKAPVSRATPSERVQTMSVYAMGEIAKPGKLAVEPGTTLMQFVAQAGGFTKFAATKRVQLRRLEDQTGVQKVYTINYRKIMRDGGTKPIILTEGDVIIVPERRLFE